MRKRGAWETVTRRPGEVTRWVVDDDWWFITGG